MKVNEIDFNEIIFKEKRGNRRIEITKFDLLLLVWLDKFGYARIDTFVTDEISYDRVSKKFKKFYEYGYVDRFRFNIYYKYDYRLKQKGMYFLQDYYYADELEASGVYERTIARYNEKMSDHQNLCAKIGWLLLMSGIDSKEILSDRDLKMFINDRDRMKLHKKMPVFSKFRQSHAFVDQAVLSDLVIGRNSHSYIGIEIEKSYKGQARTNAKLKNIAMSRCVSSLWLVNPGHKTLKDLIRTANIYWQNKIEFVCMDIGSPDEEIVTKVHELLNKAYVDDQKQVEKTKRMQYKAKLPEIKEKGLDKDSLDSLGFYELGREDYYWEIYLQDDYVSVIVDKYIIPHLEAQISDMRALSEKMEQIPRFSFISAEKEENRRNRENYKQRITNINDNIQRFVNSTAFRMLPSDLTNKLIRVIDSKNGVKW